MFVSFTSLVIKIFFSRPYSSSFSPYSSFLLIVLLSSCFHPLYSVPLLTNVHITRPEQNAVNISASGFGVANSTGSYHNVLYASNVNIDTSNDLSALEVVDNFGVSYGPSDWQIVQSLDLDLNGWIVQSTPVTQLIVNPVSLAVAQSAYRGTHLIAGDPTWSDIVIEVDVRSQTPEDKDSHSTGLSWRVLDGDNHYMFLINVDCGFAKVVRVRNRNQELLASGPTVLVKDYNFGPNGRIPKVTDVNEFAYILGTKLSTCMGSCQIDTDCPGSLFCFVNTVENGVVPGCQGPGTEGWGYCILPQHRPPEDATTTGFLSIDNTLGLSGALGMLQCQGDCDSDRDCLGSLICIMREEKTKMPGCSGLAVDFWDYCGRQESEPTFVKDEGPADYAAHDGYAIEFRNKDSLKTTSYIFHVESQSNCASDADADILDGGYKICAWVKVGTNYNGVHQVLATSFWNKKLFVGHTSTLNHCNADDTCQLQIESALPFQQREQWHYVCDMFISKSSQITSMDIFIGYPVRASQGKMLVTGITIERRATNAPADAEALNLIGMTKSDAANFRYSLRITNIKNEIMVELNGKLFINLQDTSSLALTEGKISLFSSGSVNTGFRNLAAYPIKGSAVLEGPVVTNVRLSLVNESKVNNTEIISSRVLVMMQGCPPLASADSCGDYQISVMAPPDPPRVFNFVADLDSDTFRLSLGRPSSDGGSTITHYKVWYCAVNGTRCAKFEEIIVVLPETNVITKDFGPISGGQTLVYNFGAAGCSHVGCGNEAGIFTDSPTLAQNLSLALTDSAEELSLTVGFPADTGGIPITHYLMEVYPVFDDELYDLCQGIDLSTSPPLPIWEVQWNDGEPSIFPFENIESRDGVGTMSIERWSTAGSSDYFQHIIPGPRGPNTAVDTQYGSGFRLKHNGGEYYFKNKQDYTINAITRGPFKDHNDWHTLSRGTDRDHHIIVHSQHHYDWKMAFFKNGNPNSGYQAFEPATYMKDIFGGTNGNDPYDQAGIWKDLTVVSKQGVMSYYIDGEFMGKIDKGDNPAHSSQHAGIRSIGCHDNNHQKWGPLASFSFWDYALEEEAIKNIKQMRCSQFGNEQRKPNIPVSWVLAAVIDGTRSTFDYDKSIWTDTTTLDADGEKKTAAFNDIASNDIRIEFERSETSCIQQFDYSHNLQMTLREIFAGGQRVSASPGKAAWIGLGCNNFAIQPHCNRHGFNVEGGWNKIRYGIIFNNENNCNSPDASVGIGIKQESIAAGGQYGCCKSAGIGADQPVTARIYIQVPVPKSQWPIPSRISQYVLNIGSSSAHTVPYTIVIRACNNIFCGEKKKVRTNVPSKPSQTTLSNAGAPADDNLQVTVVDGDDGGLPILHYKIQFMKETEVLKHIPCDVFTGGQPCVATSRTTSEDTCKLNGLNLVVPRSKEHWIYMFANFKDYMKKIIPGIYRPTNRCGNECGKIFNSEHLNFGDYGDDTWQAIDGGPWWVRDTSYGEPNGDYTGTCWLSLKNADVDNLKYNDAWGCPSSRKYLCSNNVPQEFSEPDPTGKITYALVDEFQKTRAELADLIYMETSGSRPFMVHVYPCNQFGCSLTPGISSTQYPPAPEKVGVRVTGASQLSLDFMADARIAGTDGLEFVVNIQNRLWLDHISIPEKWFSVQFQDGSIIDSLDNYVGLVYGNGNGFESIVGPGTDNLNTGVDSWKSESIVGFFGVSWPVIFHDRNNNAQDYAECEGDCDNDDQCLGDLVCFQTDSIEVVPGCMGLSTCNNCDFCHNPTRTFPILGADWTISVWVKFDATVGGNLEVGKLNRAQVLVGGDLNSARSEFLRGPVNSPILWFVPTGTTIDSDNELQDVRELGYWSNSDDTFYTSGITAQSFSGEWQNIGVIASAGVQKFYIDGKLEGQTTSAFSGNIRHLGGVGVHDNFRDENKQKWGAFGSFTVWNIALTEEQLQSSLNVAVVNFEEQTVAAGTTSLTIIDPIFTQYPMKISVFCRTFLGKSYKATSMNLWEPTPPVSASLRVVSTGRVTFQIGYPNNDGGATVIHWKIVMTPPTAANEYVEVNHVDGHVGSVDMDSIDAGTAPRAFAIYSCSLLGCSPFPRIIHSRVPDGPSFFNIINHNGYMTWTVTIQSEVLAATAVGVSVTQTGTNGVGTLEVALDGSATTVITIRSAIGQTFDTAADLVIGGGSGSGFTVALDNLGSITSDTVATDANIFEVSVGLPATDGGANHNSYRFVATCYPDGQPLVTSSITKILGDLSFESGLYSTTVPSPITTDNTCKVEAHSCSIVGCSTEIATSWNIGLNSITSATLINVIPPGNITLKFFSLPEAQKDINPITTELRWVHHVNKDTFSTTEEIAEDTKLITGNFLSAFDWKSTFSDAIVLNVFLAGSLLHQIERRHCYNDLCGDWLEILDVLPKPLPGVPQCLEPISLVTGFGCVKTLANPVGGEIRVEWDPPEFWGENSLQRGRAYLVTVSACASSSLLQECILKEFIPKVTYQTTNVYYNVPNLLASKRYQFRVQALNGNNPGAYTKLSEAISPQMNKPAAPEIPILKVANPEAVTLDFQLPRMHGAAVYDCDMAFGIVGACGVAAAEFDDFRQFAVGLPSWHAADQPGVLYNLGLMYEAGRHAKKVADRATSYYQKAADLKHVNAMKKMDLLNEVADAESIADEAVVPTSPVPGLKTDQWLTKNKQHYVTIGGLTDDTTYSVKLRCRNEFGIGLLSSYSIPFHTPKIITIRNISLSPSLVPAEYMTTLTEWSTGKTSSDFFARFPVTFDGETYTKDHFCRTHPNQCGSQPTSVGSQPFSYIAEDFNNTKGTFVKQGWHFAQGDDRYCKKEFPKATCRSLGEAIKATLFDGVTFFIGKGVYRHRGNGTIETDNTELAASLLDATVLSDANGVTDSIAAANATNVTNMTVVREAKTLPILHHDEHFPIKFPKLGSHLVAMDNLLPSDVIIDCGGKMCFDFTPASEADDGNNQNHPFVRLQGLTITGGVAGNTGGPAIYAPMIKMQEWKYNGILQSVIIIQSCIFQNHTSGGEGGVIYIKSKSFVQNWEVHNSTFINNRATGSGGAINIDSSVILLSHVHFESNTALGWGGVLRATSKFVGSAVRVTGLHSLNNLAGIGGGVFSVLGANINVNGHSESTNDVALGRDGGGFLVAEASTIKVSNTTLKHLQATTSDGGAFNVMGSIVELTNLNISDTLAKTSGGALTSQLCTLKMNNIRVVRARVTGTARDKTSGGALALFIRTRCEIVSSTFVANEAPFAGGAINCDGCTSLTVVESSFSQNSAGRGGAISCLGQDGGLPVNILSGDFVDNAATVAGGGAIFWERWPPPMISGDRATLDHISLITSKAEETAGSLHNIIQVGNTALYGKFIASGPTAIYFERNDRPIAMNTKAFGPHFTLRDNYTNQVIDRDDGVSIKLRAGCNTAPGFGDTLALVSPVGNATFPGFGIAGEPSSMRSTPHTVTAAASEASVDPVTFTVVIQDCFKGEFLSKLGDAYACTNCLSGTFETKINQMKCTECDAGQYQDESGQKECKTCPLGYFQSKRGQTACGDPDIISWYPVVTNLTRTRNATNDYQLHLTWLWPEEAETEIERDGLIFRLPSKPMIEVSTKADFDENFRGDLANLTVTIDYVNKNSAIVHFPVPVYDLVVYTRVRINSGTAVGEWTSLLDPYELTSDCNDEWFLNDLGDRFLVPDRWVCEKCPLGTTCIGNVRWGQVYAKFGFWRVEALTEIMDENKNIIEVDDPTVPDYFQECLFQAACFGAANSYMAGKYYNLTEGEQLSEDTEDLALSDKGERCNWEWGHSHMCSEYGNTEKVRCRLCQNCRQGYKRHGRARCKVCPESTANRVLLGFGVVGVIAGFYSVVYMSINSAGTEAEVSEAVKKVIINFLQICSLAALFPLKWPPAIEAIFALMSAVSSPAQHLLSPDCELSWMSGAEAFYNKQIGYAIMPIVVVLICTALWGIAFICNSRKHDRTVSYYYDRVVLTVVCILFLLYPTMVKQSLGALACERVGTIYYLAVDLQEVCYETRHAWFVLVISIPQIVLYTIGLPFGATLILYRNRFNLTDRRVQFRMGILYHGYRHRLYWWELTIAMRKVVLVLIAGIYGVRLGPDMQVTVALLLIMLFTASHLVFSPFAQDDQRALPEIPFEIQEQQRLKKLEKKNQLKATKLVQKGKHKKLTKAEQEFITLHDASNGKSSSTTLLAKAKGVTKGVKSTINKTRTKWREFYFTMISKTNMHMIEFGSLACSGFTLWSGLVFFLNDQQPRMSRFWTEVFSILVAGINVLAIIWMVLKYVLAIIREAHTRTAISVWMTHAFEKTKRTKGQDMWRDRMKQVNKNTDLAINGPAEKPKESSVRVRPAVKRWSQIRIDTNKLQAIEHAAQAIAKYEGSDARKHQKLEKEHQNSRRRLHKRLTIKYGKSQALSQKKNMKSYAAVAHVARNKNFQQKNKTSDIAVGSHFGISNIPNIKVETKASAIRKDLGKKMGSEKLLKRVFKRLDVDNSGHLDQTEFGKLIFAIEKKRVSEDVLTYLWDIISGDDDEITLHELWMFIKNVDPRIVESAERIHADLRKRITKEKLLEKIFKKLDTDGSNTIDFDEFCKLLMAIENKSLPEVFCCYLWDAAKGDSNPDVEDLTIHQMWEWIHGTKGLFRLSEAELVATADRIRTDLEKLCGGKNTQFKKIFDRLTKDSPEGTLSIKQFKKLIETLKKQPMSDDLIQIMFIEAKGGKQMTELDSATIWSWIAPSLATDLRAVSFCCLWFFLFI